MKIAIIPARGGSKRIKRKNIKDFYGTPMIARAIKTAINSEIFDEVIVSTDDEEIMRISEKFGARIPFKRPENISDDFTITSTVIKHALQECYSNNNKIEAVCCIYPTSPFLIKQDLIKSFNMFKDGSWEYVFSSTNFPSSIFRSFSFNSDLSIRMFDKENYKKRTQDFPEAYYDAAQFYWASHETWLNEKPIFTKRSTALNLPRWRVLDIDTMEDWENAEIFAPVIFNQIKEL